MKKQFLTLLAAAMLLCTCCLPALAEVTMKIDESVTYQTIESFGTSGAWWSQYVGLWDDKFQKTQVTNRSRIATLLYHPTYGIGLTNSVGLIDADYRGELQVNLINHGKEPFVVHDGDRIAQFLLMGTPKVEMFLCDTLDETARGTGGFGSTGK